MQHIERHRSHRVGWLRAGVLGANDGIVSTASLVLGVAAADTNRSIILTAGMAGLVAGALSMAVGEFVSVSSQRDVELGHQRALLARPACLVRRDPHARDARAFAFDRFDARAFLDRAPLCAHDPRELGDITVRPQMRIARIEIGADDAGLQRRLHGMHGRRIQRSNRQSDFV